MHGFSKLGRQGRGWAGAPARPWGRGLQGFRVPPRAQPCPAWAARRCRAHCPRAGAHAAACQKTGDVSVRPPAVEHGAAPSNLTPGTAPLLRGWGTLRRAEPTSNHGLKPQSCLTKQAWGTDGGRLPGHSRALAQNSTQEVGWRSGKQGHMGSIGRKIRGPKGAIPRRSRPGGAPGTPPPLMMVGHDCPSAGADLAETPAPAPSLRVAHAGQVAYRCCPNCFVQ